MLSASVAVCDCEADAAPTAAPGAPIQVVRQAAGWRGMADGSVVEYWMTGSDGRLQPASGALFVPPGPTPPTGWPIVALDHGTSGLGPGCGGQTNAVNPGYRPSRLLTDIVARGFAVVAPDYLGLGRFDTGPHPYLEIRTEATATIDLVRAARAVRTDLSETWAVVGGSQGGQAALGAGHLQRQYAPELDFRGTVALDPESDVEKVFPLIGPYVPYLPSPIGIVDYAAEILAGLRAARPGLDVDRYLTPKGRAALDRIGSLCSAQIGRELSGVSIGELVSQPLFDGRFRAALDEYMTVPTSGYDAPILLLLNATDASVPSPLHAALAAQLAANRTDFRSVVGFGEHTAMNPQMWDALYGFLDAMVAGPHRR